MTLTNGGSLKPFLETKHVWGFLKIKLKFFRYFKYMYVFQLTTNMIY